MFTWRLSKMDSFEVCTIRSWPQSLYEVALNFVRRLNKFVWSLPEVHAKLVRSSCEVGPKFVQSLPEVL